MAVGSVLNCDTLKNYYGGGRKKIRGFLYILVINSVIISILNVATAQNPQNTKITKIYQRPHNKRHNSDIKIIPRTKQIHLPPSYEHKLEKLANNKKHLNPIKKIKLEKEKQNSQRRLRPGKKLERTFRPLMGLKGIYVQSGNKRQENRTGEKFSYSKKINNLIENNVNRDELSAGHLFKSKGEPFKLYKDTEGFQPKKHPITLYLDFYPMAKGFRKTFEFPSELPINTSRGSSNLNNKQQHGMIIKLNLYPKRTTLYSN